MKFVADLHVHSRFSRATSRDLDLTCLHMAAQTKGVSVIGTGDMTHPTWLEELKQQLIEAEDGLYMLRDDSVRFAEAQVPGACRHPVRFMLTGEVSTIYRRDGRVRKVHHLICAASFEVAERLGAMLARIGNVSSDGRPILGLDSRQLLEMVLEAGPRHEAVLIPAHIWTPWFSCLGSKSGFDSIQACFGSLFEHVFAVETGLSSDPPMNWRLSSLDDFALVSNSDAHSAGKLAREANLFDTDLSYHAVMDALRSRDKQGFLGTIEFFPEEGKYHLDGHRKCELRLTPGQTREMGGICPVCGKPITVGVLHRVEELADRAGGVRGKHARDFWSLISLNQVLSEVIGKGANTKAVTRLRARLLADLGPEIAVLKDIPLEEIRLLGSERLAEALRRMRSGEVYRLAGFDGEYGTVSLFASQEKVP